MAHGTSRGGFTLVELMITAVISAVILGAVVSSFVGGIRLLKVTFATAEMSLRARDLRDRLLFHAAPTHDNTVWAGLLSGTNSADVLEANATKILMHCAAMKTTGGTTATQTIQLVFKDPGTAKCSFFSEDRYDERWPYRWLHPGGLNLFAGFADTEKKPLVWAHVPKPDGEPSDEVDHTRFYIDLKGRADVTGLLVEHNERIVVTVFGKQQITWPREKGGLGNDVVE